MMMNQSSHKPAVGLCSGGFAPLHKGHLHYLQEASENCDYLIVAVNDDNFLITKHGHAFMEETERCEIINALGCVNHAFVFHPNDPNDPTVKDALKEIKPDIFFKGGDRHSPDTIPEWELCQELGIKVQIVGYGKENSSSDIIQNSFNMYKA